MKIHYSQSLNFLFCKMGKAIVPPSPTKGAMVMMCEMFGMGQVLHDWGPFSQGPSRKVGRGGKPQPDLVEPPHFGPGLALCVAQPRPALCQL